MTLDEMLFNLDYISGTNCTKYNLSLVADDFTQLDGTLSLIDISLIDEISGDTYTIDFTSNLSPLLDISDNAVNANVDGSKLVFDNADEMTNIRVGEVLGIFDGTYWFLGVVINMNTTSFEVNISNSPSIVKADYDIYKLNLDLSILASDINLNVIKDGIHYTTLIMNFLDTGSGETITKEAIYKYPYFCNAKCCVSKHALNLVAKDCSEDNMLTTLATLQAWSNIFSLELSVCCGKEEEFSILLESLSRFCELIQCEPCNCN